MKMYKMLFVHDLFTTISNEVFFRNSEAYLENTIYSALYTHSNVCNTQWYVTRFSLFCISV